jgi:hypothetical protein
MYRHFYIILDLTVYEQRLTFVCLYVYNTDVPQFFTDILYNSAEFANTSYLFCGDWNISSIPCHIWQGMLKNKKTIAE